MGGRGEVRAAHFLDLGPIVSLEWVNRHFKFGT